MIHLPDIESSLISAIEYDEESLEITIYFKKYYVDQLTYIDFSYKSFDELLQQKSVGKFYLNSIKNNFKLKQMADKPKSKNESSDKKRFIQMRLNVKEINKAWIFGGEKGDYLDITLMLLPDGQVDKYGSLGMIVQKVPKTVWEKDKKAQGNILGNGYEYEWSSSSEAVPGNEQLETLTPEEIDDLPF